MQYIIDRAASEADFRQRLAENPLGVARSVGYGDGIEGVKDLLDLRDAPSNELCELLHLRLSRLYSGKWI
jgi:hypothetical protein